jgi:hypothetical protein
VALRQGDDDEKPTGAADFRVVLGVEHVAADVNVLRQFLALRQRSQGRQPPRRLDMILAILGRCETAIRSIFVDADTD